MVRESLVVLLLESSANEIEALRRHQMVKTRLRTSIMRLGNTRICSHLDGESDRWMRFVPIRFVGPNGGANFLGYKDVGLSSTLIRMHLDTKQGAELLQALTGLALSPELLIQYANANRYEIREI